MSTVPGGRSTNSALPLIADESCITEEDVDRCAGCFHGINIKLVKCGGLAAARRMIARARELGLKVMVGCMTESTVGISALAQLLPLLDYVDMDGAVLLAQGHRHRRPAGSRQVHLSECQRHRRAVDRRPVSKTPITIRR